MQAELERRTLAVPVDVLAGEGLPGLEVACRLVLP